MSPKVKKKKRKRKIRVIALCVLLLEEHIFVTEYEHDETGEPYYRPLGGGVDFGEFGDAAVQREMREEIDAEITDIQYIGMLENIFTIRGDDAHQICLMYQARFVEDERNDIAYATTGHEGENTFKALWMPLSHFREGHAPLYPNGFLDMLTQQSS